MIKTVLLLAMMIAAPLFLSRAEDVSTLNEFEQLDSDTVVMTESKVKTITREELEAQIARLNDRILALQSELRLAKDMLAVLPKAEEDK